MVPPITLACRACGSQIGEPCTAPTDTGRRYVRWFHLLREDDSKLTEVK